MVDQEDFIYTTRSDGSRRKKCRHYCDNCGADRGYLNGDGKPLCYMCAIKQRNAQNNWVPTEDRIVTNGHSLYHSFCPTCGKDKGYIQKSTMDSQCGSCASVDRMKKRQNPDKQLQAKVRRRIKSRIHRSLKHRNINDHKYLSKIHNLKFSIEDLVALLESKFKPGMTWDNHGEWEIDHIIPDSWFEYTSMTDDSFHQSWSLDNLQPLWKSENRQKSNRYAG